MNLLDELERQLQTVALLAECVARSEGGHRRAAYAELVQHAAAYAWIDSHVVHPALRRAGWRGVRSDLLAGSAELQRTLAELLVRQPEAPDFDDALRRFRAAVASLGAAQRETLQPALQQAGLDEDPLALLDAARAFQMPPRDAPFDLSQAERLVQETALLLAVLHSEARAARDDGYGTDGGAERSTAASSWSKATGLQK